jgi:hypothetical protein
MKDLLFALADLWMVYAGFRYGWRFLRRYHNYLLGIEWLCVAVSGCNFLVWSLLGSSPNNPEVDVAYFFDAFSRSVGITLILVLGLMRVTHRYKPGLFVEIGAFALAVIGGAYLQQFREGHFYAGPATYYLVVNVLTTLFLLYFARRLQAIGATGLATATAVVTLAATAIAVMYDFLPFPDDAYRTTFYILACATWGFQLFIYFRGYQALQENNEETGLEQPARSRAVAEA